MNPNKMSATHAIEHLAALMDSVELRLGDLRQEFRNVAAQWKGIKDFGGARDDHAASLLKLVLDRLNELSAHTRRCELQLHAIIDNPFGDVP